MPDDVTAVRRSLGLTSGQHHGHDPRVDGHRGVRRPGAQGAVFVCPFLAGHEDYRHELGYEDRKHDFLTRYPSLYGYTLVCPRRHVGMWYAS